MKHVSRQEFFRALGAAGKKGLDPMPQRKTDDWVCQKTFKVFGQSKHVGVGNKWDYFLNI